MILLCLFIVSYLLYLHHYRGKLREHNKSLLLIGALLIYSLLLVKISVLIAAAIPQITSLPITTASVYFGIPIATAAMTLCLFLGIELALPLAAMVAICSALIFENRFELFVFFFLNSIMGAYWIQNCRERKTFIKVGFKLGLLNVLLALAIDVYVADFMPQHHCQSIFRLDGL